MLKFEKLIELFFQLDFLACNKWYRITDTV